MLLRAGTFTKDRIKEVRVTSQEQRCSTTCFVVHVKLLFQDTGEVVHDDRKHFAEGIFLLVTGFTLL